MTFNSKDRTEILENAICWIVVFAMFVYGGAKFIQFEGASAIDKTVSKMTGMELMWAFYGYSKSYAVTLGLMEIIGGILIFIKKTRIIGCLFVSAILVNVIFQDIYFEVHLGALKTAILYQVIILIVLWRNRQRLIQSVKILINSDRLEESKMKFFVKLGIAFVFFVVLRIVEFYLTIR